jgi:sensor domain CHASE-containing protein
LKIKSDYILRELAGQNIVVPVGSEAVNFNGIITLNNSGKRLFKKLQEESSKEELITLLLEHYEVRQEQAKSDVEAFLLKLESNNILE